MMDGFPNDVQVRLGARANNHDGHYFESEKFKISSIRHLNLIPELRGKKLEEV